MDKYQEHLYKILEEEAKKIANKKWEIFQDYLTQYLDYNLGGLNLSEEDKESFIRVLKKIRKHHIENKDGDIMVEFQDLIKK